MKIETKEDIANFIESHLKELGGEAYGVNYIAEKLFEWHESKLKNLRLGVVVKPKGTFCQTPDKCQMSYYHQIGDYYCSKCEKTGLT